MIINKQILQKVGSCEESINHFITILGNNNPNFSMSYNDALIYLANLRDNNRDKYNSWYTFVEELSSNPQYIKLSAEFVLGEYVSIADTQKSFKVLSDCINYNENLYLLQKQNYLLQFEKDLCINAVISDLDENETLMITNSTIDNAKHYFVFDPLNGNQNILYNFDDALKKLDQIKNNIMNQLQKPKIGQQILMNNEIVAIDILEDV